MKNIIVVDIDGTIAKVCDERLKFLQQDKKDWDSFYAGCYKDEPITEICNMVYNLSDCTDYEIVFCTGRRDSERGKTKSWIIDNVFWGDEDFYKTIGVKLLMRPNGDFRHDTIVKPELLEKVGIELDRIAFVLEDRDSMVKKWRELGVKCLQVAEGNF